MDASHEGAPPPNGRVPFESDMDRAMANAAARLRRRGVSLTESETSSQLVRLLTAVEDFEQAVERSGGDNFINAPGGEDPENPNFVLPSRRADERVDSYIGRIESATERIDRAEA